MHDIGYHIGDRYRRERQGRFWIGGRFCRVFARFVVVKRAAFAFFDAIFPEIPDFDGHWIVFASQQIALEMHSRFEEDAQTAIDVDGLCNAPSLGRFDDFWNANDEFFIRLQKLNSQFIAPVLQDFVGFGVGDFTSQIPPFPESEFGQSYPRRQDAHGFFGRRFSCK